MSITKCLLLVTLFGGAFCLPSVSRAQGGEKNPVPQFDALDRPVETHRQELGIPGCALAIVVRGRVVYQKGFGWRDADRKLPVTPTTQFAIGSCTKAFTGMLAAMASEEGRPSLDASPKKYLPCFHLADPYADAHVTIRDLLCHRSGVASGAGELASMSGVMDRSEVIQAACRAKATAGLRERFQYNSAMFSAAGEAVAEAQGSSWEHLLREQIFRPLGMTASNTSREEMMRSPDFALGYAPPANPSDRPRRMPMADATAVGPSGSINSNLVDLTHWLEFLLAQGAYAGRQLVPPHAFQECVTPQENVGKGEYYGLGWGVRRNEWNGHGGLWHNGSVPGFYAEVRLLPEQEVGFVLLCNIPNSPQARSLAGFVREAVWTATVGGESKHLENAPPTVVPPPQPSYVPPLSVDALMDKVVAALGGNSRLRRHRRMRQAFTLSAQDQGITGEGILVCEAPIESTCTGCCAR